MNSEYLSKFLLSLPEAQKGFPFGPDVAVYKVSGKMFATQSHHKGIDNINLKCDPDEAFILRDIFAAVKPGYHMNKTHWNTVEIDGSIATGEIERMIENSYRLVAAKLTKTEQQRLRLLHPEFFTKT